MWIGSEQVDKLLLLKKRELHFTLDFSLTDHIFGRRRQRWGGDDGRREGDREGGREVRRGQAINFSCVPAFVLEEGKKKGRIICFSPPSEDHMCSAD